MSREKQIEEMAGILASDCGNCTECDCFHKEINGVDACYHKYAEMLYNADYRKQEWISVEERLPEKGGRYLVFNPKRAISQVISARYSAGENRWFGAEACCYFEGITHWMPLPEPPQGE